MESVDDIGGIPVVMRMLLEGGLLHGDCLTVTGKTVAQNLEGVALPSAAQDVIFPLEKPYAPAMRHIIILKVQLGIYCCTDLISESSSCELAD